MPTAPIVRTIVKVGDRYWTGWFDDAGLPDHTQCFSLAATFGDAGAASDAAVAAGILDFTTRTYREYRQ